MDVANQVRVVFTERDRLPPLAMVDQSVPDRLFWLALERGIIVRGCPWSAESVREDMRRHCEAWCRRVVDYDEHLDSSRLPEDRRAIGHYRQIEAVYAARAAAAARVATEASAAVDAADARYRARGDAWDSDGTE
ncbi:hypothetical protein JDV02_009916 [Purpureocillium takamizusanense]|uniref:Uncharacterized protein n=1 Tax=Purpureocillium takamizusanense TaxID=2060973 RepID=A0A9Q8QR21_9HYPO|nr:uncharacterized protein JDV02_009916 [Purpureocillium takamizusanense]UNI24143.1 hypothetical protein JDV02_009916 [Purpureocillium takamizusanense]